MCMIILRLNVQMNVLMNLIIKLTLLQILYFVSCLIKSENVKTGGDVDERGGRELKEDGAWKKRR